MPMTPDAPDKQLERIKLFPTAPVVFSSFPYTSKVTDIAKQKDT
jgi:hypothetical protein